MKAVRIYILLGLVVLGVGILLMTNRQASERRELGNIGEGNSSILEEDFVPEVVLSRRPLSRPEAVSEVGAVEGKPSLLEGLNDSKGTIENDLAIVDNLLFSYFSVFKEYPYGENADWVQAFSGGNKRRIAFLPKERAWLDEKQQLVDRWGAPFYFHRISGNQIEIRSAGPDGVHWTEDDHSSIEQGSEELSQSHWRRYSLD